MCIHACGTPGGWLCAALLRSGLPEAESHQVYSEPGPPWTQIHRLPGRPGDPALCYHGYSVPRPAGRNQIMKT